MLIAPTDPELRWYVLHTHCRQETRVVAALGIRHIEGYCPRLLEPRLHSWEPKGPVPSFPGYVFGRFVLGDGFAAADHCTGASGLVRIGLSFAALPDATIAALRDAEGDRGYVDATALRKEFRQGSRVVVTRGPLAGLEGTVARYLPAKVRVQLLMKAVWAGRRVELDARNVKPA